MPAAKVFGIAWQRYRCENANNRHDEHNFHKSEAFVEPADREFLMREFDHCFICLLSISTGNSRRLAGSWCICGNGRLE